MENNLELIMTFFGYIHKDEYKGLVIPSPIRIRKAGIWQGQDEYKDLNMFVLRDSIITEYIPKDINKLKELCKPDMPWAETHFQERIGGYPLNPGESYKIWPYANFDKNTEFQTENKRFDHTYMERFWPKKAGNTYEQIFGDGKANNSGLRFELGDYNDVIEQLTNNPLTRQAYLPIFFPEDTGSIGNIRVPCTLGYLFEIWDGKLDMTYYIRSCDVFRHLRNDIYLAGRLMQHTSRLLIMNGLSIKPGKLTMQIANLHLFENDLYPFQQKEKKIKLNTWN